MMVSHKVKADDFPPEVVVQFASRLEPWEQARYRRLSKAWGRTFRDLEFWKFSPSWRSAVKGDEEALRFFLSKRYNRNRDVDFLPPKAFPSKRFIKRSRYAGRRVTSPQLQALLVRNLFQASSFDDQKRLWQNITNVEKVARTLGPGLTKLNLSTLKVASYTHFSRLRYRFPNLRQIELGSWPLETLITTCVDAWPDLTELRCVNKTSIPLETWRDFFANHPHLKKLHIKLSLDHDPFDPGVVLSALALCPELEELHVTNAWGGASLVIEGSETLRSVQLLGTEKCVIEAVTEKMNVTEFRLTE